MKKALALILFVIVAGVSETAEAQRLVRGRWYRVPGRPAYRYGVTWTPFGWYPWVRAGGYGGTTLHGDYARGMAELLRARSQAAERQSKAMINYEEARKKYIENREKWLQLYRERQRRLRADRQEKIEQEQAQLQRYLEWRKQQQHPRLSPDELDPNTGELTWPAVLKAPEFETLRNELNGLFATRSRTGITPELTKTIYEKAQQMRAKLLEKVRELPAKDYMEARRFLERMAHEAHHPVR